MENKTSFHKFMDATNPVKIELATINQLKELSDVINKDYKDFNTEFAQTEQMLKSSQIKGKSLLTKYDTLNQTLQEVSKQLKDLGVDPNTYPEWKKAKDTYVGQVNGIQSLVSGIANFLK